MDSAKQTKGGDNWREVWVERGKAQLGTVHAEQEGGGGN